MKTKAGIALVLLGAFVFVAWDVWTETRIKVPLDVPITLRAGETVTQEFHLNLDGLYLIEIQAQPTLPPDTLDCLMGIGGGDARCDKIVPAIVATWILWRNGREVQRGTSAEVHTAPAELADGPVRVIGEFAGDAGGSYRLGLTTFSDGRSLEPAHPRLRVAVSSLARTDFQSAGVLVFSISFICVLFGAVLLGVTVFAPKTRRGPS
jgi:hypothetical protein